MLFVYWLFCFFKQKTAYEMRISDWSSDVCSSDLTQRTQRARAVTEQYVDGAFHSGGGLRFTRTRCGKRAASRSRPVSSLWLSAISDNASGKPSADRKSVVSGKSVSVRVDLGGRRIIKKKQHRTKKP